MLDRHADHVPVMDRLGLGCLGLLLLSPLVFKVRLAGDVVMHPFAPLLLAAWVWTLWAALQARRQGHEPQLVKWSIIIPPVLLMGILTMALAVSLVINSLRVGSWQAGGWLLLAKGLLYLAPLAFTALLVVRSGLRVMRLLNWMIPSVAFFTLVYSFYRFVQDPAVSYVHARSESEARYFAMGTFGEVLTGDGLVFRTDTVGQGAYGMYLVLVVVFSLALALLSGLNAGLPRWYLSGQAMILCPAALMGILYTGSRSSLVLLSGVLVIFILLVLRRTVGAWSQRRVLAVFLLSIIVSAGLWTVRQHLPVSLPALDRLEDTLKSQFELKRSALGTFSPVTNDPRKAVVRNVESRLWIWGRVVRYLAEHPMVLLTGIGNDRKRFVEEVIGLSYDGDHVHFQTAHNLFLDVLVKGGLGALVFLVGTCVYLFRLALRAVKIDAFREEATALKGVGWMMLSFWPPFLLVNLVGEEMFTDNLQLHWTMLFGLLLGLLSLASFDERAAPDTRVVRPSPHEPTLGRSAESWPAGHHARARQIVA